MPVRKENVLEIKGTPELIKGFKALARSEDTAISMNNFIPMPKEYSVAPFDFNEGKVIMEGNPNDIREEEQYLREKYDAENWYFWILRNWGCESDIWEGQLVKESPEFLQYKFQTLWWSPIEWLEQVAIMFPELQFNLVFSCDWSSYHGEVNATGDKFNCEYHEY